ncbi:type VI secretion system ATPase TssH [Agaribacterium haliotis]|uniref:type VI secretion system ATPase TssH n=1 Tax=Agaribacterium haliotis TaxID=2013869 RepID=UPI000BB53B06|nr:type VI secretion system ATPase TssH [Agaribacterium haliotis]
MINLDLKSLVGKLNEPSRMALEAAAGLCLSRTHYNVEVEHWLLKLLEQDGSDLRLILEKCKVDIGQLNRELNAELDSISGGNTRAPALSQSIVDLAKSAWLLSSVEYGHAVTTSAHILTALLLDESLRRSSRAGSGELGKLNAESVRELCRAIVGSTEESKAAGASATGDAGAAPSNAPALDKYTVNLTKAAQEGKIDKVLGRDEEIRQIVDILTRRRQNNPILTGEAGVGKTAVVEGLALRIAQGDVPAPLREVSIYSLDLGLLQAGASVKGEFENRLKSVIAEVKASASPIIMFIDEAHTLIGAGGKEGQGDAANLLKPALARGELRTIAATTWAEYKKYFERDPALTRRFQVVKIEEPSESKGITMMRAIAPMLASHHRVSILDEAIVDSVKLSSRYIPARQLPDKSVSLLDTACARVALSQSATPAEIEDLRRRISQCDATISSLGREDAVHGNYEAEISKLHSEKDELESELQQLESQWQKEKGLVAELQQLQEQLHKDFLARENNSDDDKLSDEQRASCKSELAELNKQLDEVQGENPLIQANVNAQAVAEVVANWTGIPVGKMLADEISGVLEVSASLNKRVIGQKHALEAIAKAVQTSRAGLTDPRKPLGVFMMVGSSGVGKTETALALAELLYGGEQNLTTINMSEFKEEHKVSMLLGSPPGYVGYGEGGVLTEAVRRRPYSVVLLDEMEKAHPGVQDIFYNLFDKGTIKDGEGRDIDFRNTLIIMTSNAGEEHLRAICAQAEELPEPDVLLDNFRPALLSFFKPAFLGRCNIIPYYPLADEDLIEISRISMKRIAKRVREHYDAEFNYSDDVLVHIVARCQEVDTGARNIENILSQGMLPELATNCLEKLASGESINTVTIDVNEDGQFSYELA